MYLFLYNLPTSFLNSLKFIFELLKRYTLFQKIKQLHPHISYTFRLLLNKLYFIEYKLSYKAPFQKNNQKIFFKKKQNLYLMMKKIIYKYILLTLND